MKKTGNIKKLKSQITEQSLVLYQLPIGDEFFELNSCLGKTLTLKYTGKISCIHCGRNVKKSFNQGYCFPCVRSLAQCDVCIVKPNLCHFDKGTCREPDWGKSHCFIPHTIYLSNTSGLKVGITRSHQKMTRWIDQGASEAIVIGELPSRKLAGLLEVKVAEKLADKTNWRKMLKGQPESIDLNAQRVEIANQLSQIEPSFQINYDPAIRLDYPILKYPDKITSLNLDKTPSVEGCLIGIKGQYLIFDNGVINMRKYAGYELEVDCI